MLQATLTWPGLLHSEAEMSDKPVYIEEGGIIYKV